MGQFDTNLDPTDPWTDKTEIPVWALARVQGEPGSRRWLVYAQSPRRFRKGVTLSLPIYGKIPVTAAPAGCFYVADENGRSVRPLAVNLDSCRAHTSSR